MKYLKLFVDFTAKTDSFTDAEVGRLVRAMLSYANTGEAPKLKGNEKYIWDAMRVEIDAQRASYADICHRNRINGSKASRGQWDPVGASGAQWAQEQEYNIDDDEEDEEDILLSRTYARARRDCQLAFVSYAGRDPSPSELRRLVIPAVNNGMWQLLAAAIERAAANGAKNICAYALRILEEWAGNNVTNEEQLRRYERIMEYVRSGEMTPAQGFDELRKEG